MMKNLEKWQRVEQNNVLDNIVFAKIKLRYYLVLFFYISFNKTLK